MWMVALVSGAVLGFEISLMRLLLVASWHHFAFLLISIALLGFGASGTALCVGRRWVLGRPRAALFALALATAASMPLGWSAAQHLPIEARVLPALLWQQVGYWTLYWTVLAVPFLVGAAALGLALMVAEGRIAAVYGSNLIGSAAGGLGAVVAMTVIAPEWLPLTMGVPALIGAAAVAPARRAVGWGAGAGCIAAVGLWLSLDPPRVRVDPYKYGAYVERLLAQGSAQRVARVYGPRAVVEAYRGDALHDLPFLSGALAPPPISVIVVDGHLAGSVLEVSSLEEARVVDHTLMAFAYELAPPRPRVALLGETGGANAWLAARNDAATIDVVQPDSNVISILQGPLAHHQPPGSISGGAAGAEPRHFIEHTPDRYDVIQLVTLEGSAAGSGGVGGLGQDYLLTVEGISACLSRLSDDGLLFSCRGIQTPPRDNIKLLATYAEALRGLGVESPGEHVVIVRDYLAVCTVVKATPWTPAEVERVREACRQRELTPVWFDGIRRGELNQPDALPQPPGGVGDWYHYAATQLFSPGRDRFIDEWMFDVRPPTDERPYFADFARLRSIGALKDAFGDLWLTRSELAFLFVLAATVVVTAIGAVSIVLPLPLLREGRRHRGGRLATAGYFAAIGLGYLLLEMTCLSRLTHLIGDPVRAAAVTISGFLLLSGAGSLTAQRIDRGGTRLARYVLGGVAVVGLIELFGLRFAADAAGGLGVAGRTGVALLVIAPLGFLMGFPMPLALCRLERGTPALIPWAWGINGFASVLAPPLAMVVGMTWGIIVAGLGGIVLYGAAAVVIGRVGGRALPGAIGVQP